MKKATYIILGFSSFIFLLALGGFYFNSTPLQSYVFYASINVTDENVAGFDTNATALTFGTVGTGGGSTRKVKIENSYSFPIVAIITTEGEVGELLNFDDIVRIEEGEKKTIPFSAYIPLNFSYGLYSGRVKFLIRQA